MTLARIFVVALVLAPACTLAADDAKKDAAANSAQRHADPAARIMLPKGFQVDLLYSVPKRRKARGST